MRHGKSWFISKFLPAWYSMMFPEKNIILTGYGGDFAAEWGRQARDIVARQGRPYNLAVDKRRAKATNWSIDGADGSMRTCGTLGSITGKGAHLLISDDQVKDQAQANSPTQRDTVHRWFMADCLSRLEPDGKCLVVLSRRHPDDLVGRLLENENWPTLRLPALCDDPTTDPLGRQLDEPLWPERYSKECLLSIKDELELSGQSHIWECLYQQNPLGDPGVREWPEEYLNGIMTPGMPTNNIRLRVLALDPSKSKKSTTGDFAAFTYLVLTTEGHVHVQSWFYRAPADQVVSEAVALLDQLRPHAFIYESTMMQELFGKWILERCNQRGIPCPIWEFSTQEEKNVRIRMALTPLLGQRRLHLDANSPGNRLLLSQIREFPTGNHDDGPDSLTMGTYLLNQLLAGKKPQQKLVLKA